MIFKELSDLTQSELNQLLDRGSKVDTGLVRDIVLRVKNDGDAAVKEFTKRFDGVDIKSLKVSREELETARKRADAKVVEALEKAHENILRYHEKQLESEWWYEEEGRRLGHLTRPVESVGCYVPGGGAYYPSSVLMAAVPAKVAGVGRIIVTTPPKSDGTIHDITLASCIIAGVDEVYKVGGAQAIAALAYGTESVPKVDMIVGPGNIYVTAAKKLVFGDVGVDMLAGPSEVLIIADSTAPSDYIAADILAQAEHDPHAVSILVATDEEVASRVRKILEEDDNQPEGVQNTAILAARNLEEATRFSNTFAPEHLEIITALNDKVLEMISNAGSIFLGPYSPVAAGDYASGPNHILPTGGCARFQSGLSVGHFQKKISVQRLSKKGLKGISGSVTTLAEAEGLVHHSESVKERLKDG